MTPESPSSKKPAKRESELRKQSRAKLHADADVIRETLNDLLQAPESELQLLDRNLETPYLITSGKEAISSGLIKRLNPK